MTQIRKLLVTTDLSEAAEVALPMAAMLANELGASVSLLTVVELTPQLPPGVLSLPPEREKELEREVRERVHARLQELRERHLPEGSETLVDFAGGEHCADRICAIANERGIDMIVIATHGRGKVAQLLLGSVAERVVRTAPCPVLTVSTYDR
jgi:nucleotide-binding universal stress UspA family protein